MQWEMPPLPKVRKAKSCTPSTLRGLVWLSPPPGSGSCLKAECRQRCCQAGKDTLALQGAPAGPWEWPWGTGTLLRRLMPLSPLQRDEVGGWSWQTPPCSKAQRFPGQSQPHSCPCPWHRQHQSPMHQRGWRGHRSGTSPEQAGMGSCLLWLQRALVLGHPDCPPKTLCCCPRATPHPQELVACVVAPQLPKPVPSTLRRVYCWHEHSDLLGQGSPAPGLGGHFWDPG